MNEKEKLVIELAKKWYESAGFQYREELWDAVAEMVDGVEICPTPAAPDAGDSGENLRHFSSLIIFPVGRLRRPRPSAGNANR